MNDALHKLLLFAILGLISWQLWQTEQNAEHIAVLVANQSSVLVRLHDVETAINAHIMQTDGKRP